MAELNISQKAGSRRSALRVDLTAMVDLAFLLVTFFMLTTTLSKPQAMDLGMPVGKSGEPVSDLRSVTLCIGNHHQIYLYRGLLEHPVAPPQVMESGSKALRMALLNIRQQVKSATGKSLVVLVKPTSHSRYGDLVNTLDELNITQNYTYAIEKISGTETETLRLRHID